jgi:hypothetical protein
MLPAGRFVSRQPHMHAKALRVAADLICFSASYGFVTLYPVRRKLTLTSC